jgi:Ca2+-binding EF-hand superfamily protein
VVTENEIEELNEAFDHTNSDGSGSIDPGELLDSSQRKKKSEK